MVAERWTSPSGAEQHAADLLLALGPLQDDCGCGEAVVGWEGGDVAAGAGYQDALEEGDECTDGSEVRWCGAKGTLGRACCEWYGGCR